jgi:Flp pilus assembly protein TadG
MIQPSQRNNSRGILSRLLRDEMGNTIAIMAAAVIPVIGLVGGAVDMSRIYLVKTRLQASCDAGSLNGRKVMGNGAWADNGGLANTRANEMFNMNFGDGAYGTTNLVKTFTEAGGAVNGVASVQVPMTLMKALGQESRTISVDCTSEQRVPNTDVMFVLDVTGSMDWATSGTDPTPKIDGLKQAVKCFFESLAKEDIADIAPSVCGQTANPTSGTGTSDVRFGFVPYSVNANVGRLLPLAYVADNWTYQSREVNPTALSGFTPRFGNAGPKTETGTPVVTPLPGDWSTWEDTGRDITRGGTTYDKKVNNGSAILCAGLAKPANETDDDNGDYVVVSYTPDPPAHPLATQTVNYTRETTTETTEYRYEFRGSKCYLQRREKDTTSTTRTYTATRNITWADSTGFGGWTYKPVTHNVSGLKDVVNNSWRTSVSLPLGNDGAATAISWPGCVEERQTWINTSASPTNAHWYPVPAEALDMDIDTAPTAGDVTTMWKPILPGAVWTREDSSNNNTLGQLTSTGNDTNTVVNGSVGRPDNSCPTAAKLYQVWDPLAFQGYVNGLTTGGNTYHDVGLIWGARLMSPTGIFSGITGNAHEVIDRHMVFMTDGDTNTETDNYSSYGVSWWDRRQTGASTAPTDTWEEANLDARTNAICRAVRAKNIHLWVVAFGSGITTATEDRLRDCASSSAHYFRATSVTGLISQFNTIASQISALRLTS